MNTPSALPPTAAPLDIPGTVSGNTEQTARSAAGNSLDAQVEIMQVNMEFMIAMAWLNFVLAVTSKINGR